MMYLDHYFDAILRAYGFVPAPNAKLCPRVLTRKKCQGDKSCLCRYRLGFTTPDFLDHSFRWVDRNGCGVLTAEPYREAITRHPSEYRAFLKEVAVTGLSITNGSVNPWLATHGSPKAPTDDSSATQLLILQSKKVIPANNFKDYQERLKKAKGTKALSTIP